jgi:hypothetical protein
VTKSSNFTYFRRKYLRPVYIPLYDVLHSFYLNTNRIILARRVTKSFDFAIKKQPNSTIVIKYDHSNSPPTYGDYFVILMIARFVSMSGYTVRFEILDSVRAGSVWNAMNVKRQDEFVLDQIELAGEYLSDVCEIFIEGKFANKSRVIGNSFTKPNLDYIHVHSVEFYQWAPYFLHLLIKRHKWDIPSGFLLKSKRDKPKFNYVTWNVRKSVWAIYRDTDAISLHRDFLELRKLYPAHSIVILSNQEGLDFAFKEIEKIDPSFSSLVSREIVMAQPDNGFGGAIDWLLHSDFYFQRSGGGIGIIAIFSSVPYVIYSVEKTSFLGHYKNRRIAPWSTGNQVFRRLFVMKRTFPFSKTLN